MKRSLGRYRRCTGVLLVVCGVLLVFVCLPVQALLIALGAALAAVGIVVLYG